MKTMYHPGGLYLLVMMMLLLPLLASTPVASAAAPIPEVQPEGTAESGAEGGALLQRWLQSRGAGHCTRYI
jgi:hypothetical protein